VPTVPKRASGHTTSTTFPTTSSIGTPPELASRWYLESRELERLSPMTKTEPAGTMTSKRTWSVASPGLTYDDSSSETPLRMMRPCSSQHCTRSPGSPITRLTRSCPVSLGSSPMNVRVSRR